MTAVPFRISFSHEDFWQDVSGAHAEIMAELRQLLPDSLTVGETTARDSDVILAELEPGADLRAQVRTIQRVLEQAKDAAGWRRVDVLVSYPLDPWDQAPGRRFSLGAPLRPVTVEAEEHTRQRPRTPIVITEDQEHVGGGPEPFLKFLTGLVSVEWQPEGHDGLQRGPQSVSLDEALAWARGKSDRVVVICGSQAFSAGAVSVGHAPLPDGGLHLRRRFSYEPADEPAAPAFWLQCTFRDLGTPTAADVVALLQARDAVESVALVQVGPPIIVDSLIRAEPDRMVHDSILEVIGELADNHAGQLVPGASWHAARPHYGPLPSATD